MIEQPIEKRNQRGDVYRFRQLVRCPGGERSFDLARRRVCRKDDHRDGSPCEGLAQADEDLITRQVGEVQVEKDDIRDVLLGQLDARAPPWRESAPDRLCAP
jgi:hypothetical protein